MTQRIRGSSGGLQFGRAECERSVGPLRGAVEEAAHLSVWNPEEAS